MTEYSKKKNTLPTICTTALTIVMMLVLLIVGLSYAKSKEHKLGECQVTNVIYPTSLDNGPFIECDCGRRCTNGHGTCIKVFVSYNRHETVMAREFVSRIGGASSDTVCTFAERTCTNGESVNNRQQAIIKAGIEAKTYLNIENTSIIDCYKSDHNTEVYLENYLPGNVLIGVGATVATLILCVIITIVDCTDCCLCRILLVFCARRRIWNNKVSPSSDNIVL